MQQKIATSLAQEMAERCLGTRIGRLHRLVTRRFEQALASTGLSLPQIELLAALTLWDAPVKPSELARVLVVERSTMSRNLAVLQQRGWVEVVQTSATGRTMSVAITPSGAAALASAEQPWAAAQRDAEAALGAQSPAELDRWLERLSA